MTNTDDGVTGETMLVVQAAGGDAEAFDALQRRHGEQAWRLAVALTGDDADAATVVPEAVATAFTGIRAGVDSPESDYGTLLLGAVRNAALDLGRTRRARGDAAGRTPSTHGVLLGRAFGELPERWRTVLWLTVVEDVAPGSVAPIVDLSPADTAQLAGRARRGLHEQFLHAHLAETGNRNCARAVARLSDHAVGSLDDADHDKLERHLSLCEACADRRDQLDELPARLALLVPAPPATVAEDCSAAWIAAVTPARTRTATGLSPTTEKLLAGVSAVAAAAGVVGAAMLGGGGGDRAATAQAAPLSPAATETEAPRPLELDPGIDVPSIGSGTDLPTLRRAASSAAGSTVIGASDPTNPATSAGDLVESPTTTPREPRSSTPDDTGGPAPAEEPVVTVGTTVGDAPVAVEVGPEPGLTVGPVSVGSEPQPAEGDEVLELGGPLAPVGDAVAQVDDQLGLGLGG